MTAAPPHGSTGKRHGGSTHVDLRAMQLPPPREQSAGWLKGEYSGGWLARDRKVLLEKGLRGNDDHALLFRCEFLASWRTVIAPARRLGFRSRGLVGPRSDPRPRTSAGCTVAVSFKCPGPRAAGSWDISGNMGQRASTHSPWGHSQSRARARSRRGSKGNALLQRQAEGRGEIDTGVREQRDGL